MTAKLLASQKRNAELAAEKLRIPGSDEKYKPKTDFRWYNDGVHEKQYDIDPGDPWVRGRLESTKNSISKGKSK